MSSRGSPEITLTIALAVVKAWIFDDLSEAELRGMLNRPRYGDSLKVKTRHVELRHVPWRDDHPLGPSATHEATFRELFGLAPEYGPDQDLADRLRQRGGDKLFLAAADLIDELRAEVERLRAGQS